MLDTNHVNRKFDDLVDKVAEWLKPQVNDFADYSKEVILDRLLQRVAEVAIGCHALAVRDQGHGLKNIFYCAYVGIDPESGKLDIPLKAFCKNQYIFFSRWIYGLFAIIFCWSSKESGPCTLLYGVGAENIFVNNSDVEFTKFCKTGPVEPLNQGKKFYVQFAGKSKLRVSKNFVYCSQPLIQLTREVQIGFAGRCRFLISHIKAFIQFQVATVSFPSFSLLGIDFAYVGIMRELIKRGIVENIIITTSDYSSQPLWMRSLQSAKLHMVAYSQNWKPIFYEKNNIDSNNPNLRFIRVDVHWVWTRAFGEYIQKISGASEVRVVGPILWRMPERFEPPLKKLQIAIFDVPAITDEIMLELGEISNYFAYENIMKFLKDISLAVQMLKNQFNENIRVVLKTKREYVKSVYVAKYYNLIEELEKEGVVEVIPSTDNMYKIISSSDLVISYPFTSTNYVADFLQIPSIYYDSTGLIVNHNFADNNSLIKFANNQERLCLEIIKSLGLG